MAQLIAGETFKKILKAKAKSVVVCFRGPQAHDFDVSSNANGDWVVSVDTTGWAPGLYSWQAWAIKEDGEKSVIESQQLTLKPSLMDAVTSVEFRSRAQIIVENIETMLAGNASEGVRRYRINNRELERYSVSELLSLLSFWRLELRKEQSKHKLGPRIAVYV